MKKLLLSGIALSICLTVSAQSSRIKSPLAGAVVDKAVKLQKAKVFETNLTVTPNSTVVATHRAALAETNIGNTTYDLQSNYGGTGNRVKTWPDATISAIWTYSADLAGTYPDRGTGYNYFNGSAWGPAPSARVESVRTGFPNLSGSATNGEFISCHNPNVYYDHRSTKGTGSWTEAPFTTTAPQISWPRVTVGGANGQTVHYIANTGAAGGGQLEEIFYWRSPDFGVTWDINEFKIPVFDATNFIDPTADGYDIDARGDVIAIVAGGFGNDLILAKSIDNGTTWGKRVIHAFPIPVYDNVSITDIDGDGVADTCDAADSGPSVVIDNNNQVHVWCGATRILNETGTVNYFPVTDGLFYWNESYPDGDLMNHPVAFIKDLDGDGLITLQSGDPGVYQCSLTGMPCGGVCASGKLFVVYTSLVENTTSGTATPQTYRDVFYSWSSDGGNTWADGVDLTNTDFDEEAFTNMNKRINGQLDIIFHRDSEPGTSLGADADPITQGDVIYFDEVVDCALGLNENSAVLTGISVYPNPSSDLVNIQYNVEKAGNINIDVVNIMGQVVSHFENVATAGTNMMSLNISKLASGVYSVKTTLGTTVYTNTIVKE